VFTLEKSLPTLWRNKIAVGDLNKDGKPDLIVGNQGLNTQLKASKKEPPNYFKDFDGNGIDLILSFLYSGQTLPVHYE
jgi:hypothetical protein